MSRATPTSRRQLRIPTLVFNTQTAEIEAISTPKSTRNNRPYIAAADFAALTPFSKGVTSMLMSPTAARVTSDQNTLMNNLDGGRGRSKKTTKRRLFEPKVKSRFAQEHSDNDDENTQPPNNSPDIHALNANMYNRSNVDENAGEDIEVVVDVVGDDFTEVTTPTITTGRRKRLLVLAALTLLFLVFLKYRSAEYVNDAPSVVDPVPMNAPLASDKIEEVSTEITPEPALVRSDVTIHKSQAAISRKYESIDFVGLWYNWWLSISVMKPVESRNTSSHTGIDIDSPFRREIATVIDRLESLELSIAQMIPRAERRKQAIVEADYALTAAGATVIHSLTSETFINTTLKRPSSFVDRALEYVTGLKMNDKHRVDSFSRPEMVLQDSPLRLGHCWRVKGSRTQITLKLGHAIVATHFTIDHIDARLIPKGDLSSAPRHLQVWASFNIQNDMNWRMIAEYEADFREKSSHSFGRISDLEEAFVAKETHYIQLRVLSNTGKATSTCLYRFRVHE